MESEVDLKGGRGEDPRTIILRVEEGKCNHGRGWLQARIEQGKRTQN